MIENTSDFNGEIDIHQRRVKLTDPTEGKTRVLVNVIIYCSQYYPLTKSLADRVIVKVIQKSPESLIKALEHLYSCIEKQTIVGPSSSFLPPSELPHISKLDGSFNHDFSDKTDLEKETSQIIEKLGLSELFPQNKTKQLMWYNCQSLLSMKSVQNNNHFYKYFSGQLQIDGQSWLESTPFPSLFVTLSYFLSIFDKNNKLQRPYLRILKLLRARLGQLHNKFLKNPVGKLAEIVLGCYKEVVQLSTETTFQDYVELLLEYSYSLLFYYKYSQSQQLMRHCADLLYMKMEFTGKLGRRTKYQSFDTALLVMNLVPQNEHQQSNKIHDSNQEDEIHLIEAKKLVHRERAITNQIDKDNIKVSTFDEENILLETPKFVEQSGETKIGKISQLSQIHLLTALGILYFEWKSTSRDQMLLQNIAASISTLLNYQIPTSFSYRFALLLLRSLNQFSRIKNTERALDQLEKLKNSFNLKTSKDTSNVYATPYETRLGFVLILADRYMEIGLSISAVGLFEQAGLFQECVQGLIAKNFKQRALETVNRLIDSRGKNPRLLCMLGDIKGGKQPELYQEAWELSKHTCARAQRSLGWLYFNKGDFFKAQISFNKATQASYYHPNTWFTLGCTRMRLNQFEGALKAFAESVSIDDSQGEAWGNMASCYMHLKKMKQAYSTLIQAVKFSERNWKLWANLLSVSLANRQFYKYFECIQRLAKLDHPQILTEEALAKVVQIMQFIGQKSEYKRAAYNCKNRLERLFDFLSEKLGGNPLVWRTKTAFLIQLLEYFDILDVHYHNQHIQKKLNPNDIVPGYETIQQTCLTTKTSIYLTKEGIVEAKQNELNMTMRVGWNQNKLESQKVRKVLIEYIEIYRKYSLRNDKEDFRLFVRGVAQKVEAGMEIEFTVPLEWL